MARMQQSRANANDLDFIDLPSLRFPKPMTIPERGATISESGNILITSQSL
jgi:hypothetical protein